MKIVDFGLSNTHDGVHRGHADAYAAPEMIAGNGENIMGPKVTYGALVSSSLPCYGYLPFEDANTSKLYKKILQGTIAPQSDFDRSKRFDNQYFEYRPSDKVHNSKHTSARLVQSH